MIETQLERIATALEALLDLETAIAEAKTIAPPKAKAEPKVKAEPKAKATRKAEITRDDVAARLTTFITEGPGKEMAKGVLGQFEAGSISTLDPDNYAAFLEALDKTFASA